MGDALGNIKRILSNKNTVTILGILLGVVVIYFAYNYRVKKAVEPISVPMAKQDIQAGEKITEDMIEYVDISRGMLNKSPGIIINSSDIIGKKVVAGQSIPEHGLFYTDQLNSPDDTTTIISNIPDGYTIFTLKVDFNSTYGNSIYPGNYIDLFAQGRDDNGRVIYAKFVESIKVLQVVDTSGKSVFGGSQENQAQPDAMLFAVPDDMYKLLYKAQLIGMNFYPVPRNLSYSKNPKDTEIVNDSIKNLIIVKTANIPDDSL